MKIYVLSKVDWDYTEMIKAFYTKKAAIEFLELISVLHQNQDVEFTIEPLELSEE